MRFPGVAGHDGQSAARVNPRFCLRAGVVALATFAMIFGSVPEAGSEPRSPAPPPPSAAPAAPAVPPSAPASATASSPAPTRATPASPRRTPAGVRTAAKKLLDVQLEVGCVAHGSVDVRAWPDLWSFDGDRFDWVLRGPVNSKTSGEVEWWAEDEQYGPLDFQLTPGHYRLTIILVDKMQVVADKQFDVLRCVTVTTSCHTITFSNPAGNPAVWVRFNGGEYLDDHVEETDKGGTLTVKPGTSTAVSTYHEEIVWSAYGPGVDRKSGSPNAGEHYSEVIDQHCGPTRTRGVVSCATGRRGLVRAWFHPPDNRLLSYRVDEWNEPIRQGRPGRDEKVKLKLRVGSSYTFRSYSAAAALPYDRAEGFEVVRCVTASRRGDTIRFRNPGGYKVRVAYRLSGDPTKTVLRLKPGTSATVRVGSSTAVRWHTNALRPITRWRSDRGRGVLRVQSK